MEPTSTDDPQVVDHPRKAEVDELWDILRHQAPPEFRPLNDIVVIANDVWLPIRAGDQLRIPAKALDVWTREELAFALAHSAVHDVIDQLAGDVAEDVHHIDKDTPHVFASMAGAFSGVKALVRLATRQAEREEDRIRQAALWVHRAGFDPNASVPLFLSLEDWLRTRQNPNKPPSKKSTVAALALTPFLAALNELVKDKPPVVMGGDRAALARTICVKLGYYPPKPETQR